MLTTAWLFSFQFQHNSTQLMCTCVSLTEESEEGRWVDCRGYWPVHHGVLSALYAGHTAEGINSSMSRTTLNNWDSKLYLNQKISFRYVKCICKKNNNVYIYTVPSESIQTPSFSFHILCFCLMLNWFERAASVALCDKTAHFRVAFYLKRFNLRQ